MFVLCDVYVLARATASARVLYIMSHGAHQISQIAVGPLVYSYYVVVFEFRGRVTCDSACPKEQQQSACVWSRFLRL